MRQKLKQYLLIALAAVTLYFVLDNHFIIKENGIYLLRKSTLDLHDTFVSLNNKRPATVLKNEELRDAGIGNLMVDLGMLTEEKKDQLEARYSYEE